MATSNSILTLRRHDLDNLRSFLTKQVIVHHTALTYGGLGRGNFVSALFGHGGSFPLTALTALDQSFFMGLFFWISGRGTAQSLLKSANSSSGDKGSARSTTTPAAGRTKTKTKTRGERKSIKTFLQSRFTRLLLPAVGYTLLLNPIVRLLVAYYSPSSASPSSTTPITSFIASNLSETFRTLRGIRGSVWYNATLFCFDVVAAGVFATFPSLRREEENDDDDDQTSSNHPTTTTTSSSQYHYYYRLTSRYAFLPLACLSFLVRTAYPVGTAIPLINLQPAYLCQYIFAYVQGFMSYQLGEPRMLGLLDDDDPNNNNNNNDNFPQSSDDDDKEKKKNQQSLPLALTLSILTLPSIILLPRLLLLLLLPLPSSSSYSSEKWLSETISQIPGGRGGIKNLPSLLYSLWNEFSFSLIGPALMDYFLRFSNHPPPTSSSSSSSSSSPRLSYAAFLLHAPVSVGVEILVDWAVLHQRGGLGSGRRRIILSDGYGYWWESLGPVVMTALVGGLNVYASYFVAGKVMGWFPVLGRWV